MTMQDLYLRLQNDAVQRTGHRQVFHEADIDGHHLYFADTSFGDGPIFRFDKHAWMFEPVGNGMTPYPVYVDTRPGDLEKALVFAERAAWEYRLAKLDPNRSEEK